LMRYFPHLLSSHKSQPISTRFKVADGKAYSQVYEAQSVLANIPTADESQTMMPS